MDFNPNVGPGESLFLVTGKYGIAVRNATNSAPMRLAPSRRTPGLRILGRYQLALAFPQWDQSPPFCLAIDFVTAE